MTIPGNHLRDNWYMGTDPITINTLGDISERVVANLSSGMKIRGIDGRKITIRMASDANVILVEFEDPNERV